VFAIIKQGEIVEINPILMQEVEKQQRVLYCNEQTLQEEKLLALKLSKELFPANDCVIVKTTHQPTSHPGGVPQHYPFMAWIYGRLKDADEEYVTFLRSKGYKANDSRKTFKHFTFSSFHIPHLAKLSKRRYLYVAR
jgi:hypothetical protein